jgi:hypothetical protein
MATPPLTIQPVPYFASAVLVQARPAVEAYKSRRAFSAPEVMEYPDDICYEWAETLFEAMEPAVRDLIQCATTEDIQAVLGYFCDPTQTWPAHRRAFFTQLHAYAMRMELEGRGDASQAFADCMRERYMPNYVYNVERRAMAAAAAPAPAQTPRTPSPLAPIEEDSQETMDD